MKLGLYTFATIVLMIIVGGLAYTVNADHYVVEFMGVNLNFPVAAWLVLPMFVLYVFTFFHMLVYGLKNHFTLNRWKKDAQTLNDALYWALLNESKEQKYLIEDIDKSAALLSYSNLQMKDGMPELNPRLTKITGILKKIQSGEYVDLKEHKLAKVFNEGNPYLIQNRLNRLDIDPKFVEEVMKSSSEFSTPVQKKALEIFASKENFFKARQFAKVFDIENFLVMLRRVNQDEDMGISQEIIKDFIDNINPTCSDFLRIAEITKKLFTPDENLALFFSYQLKNSKAQYAYLYLLFDYELMDEVGKYLDEQEDSEFMRFRALYTLKRSNARYKLEDIINIDTICREAKY
ncbi:hypothetical protein PGH07_06725 [Sulfurovum sp. zt1-1]|uniref:Uncharacterized protein n=1 Tax=Sulfurovum zhangzhouensis TaxID=3019067 RepID=A0ABT7R042_9BACT|nr:hypothetical protein [Sulfurovum zhangzhouensis]MDM5271866.1 hypothetical protein [Sulfurovum zhangzhouensis]